MIPMNDTDKQVRREIVQRATAQAVWDLLNSLPFSPEWLLDQEIITKEDIVDWTREELDKLV